MRNLLLILFLFCSSILHVAGQTDTEFWFAAPEISQSGNYFDRPIFIRISTFGTAASVEISLPANPNFTPIKTNISANNTASIDLSNYIDDIESRPADKVINKGILIKSTAPVTAYYDIASTYCKCNPEIYTLKGRNALGTSFLIPMQTYFNNSSNSTYSPVPYASFAVVATEDYTKVTITPTKNLQGHNAGTPYTVTLNKGQVYSALASSQAGSDHPAGTKVVSDKPIAITMSDDLLASSTHADVVGDQLVPVNILGTEYIAPKGGATAEKVFILATANNTKIYLNGSASAATTLNAGQTCEANITATAMFIKATYPVYVLHVTGIQEELGGALLPPVQCTGSREIGFARSSNLSFSLVLLVASGGEGSFTINGSTTAIKSTDFKDVPGTNGAWKSALITFTESQVPTGQPSLITNSKGLFHMGILNGNEWNGTEYGYFSSYTNLYLGGQAIICAGDTAVLDAGADKSEYLWSDNSTGQKLSVTSPGKYWVRAKKDNCYLSDTIIVKSGAFSFGIGEDTVICNGDSLILTPSGNPDGKFSWSDNSDNDTLVVKSPGKYWLTVTNGSCIGTDTIVVTTSVKPVVDLGKDTILCNASSYLLDATSAGVKAYRWSDNSTAPTLNVTQSGTYWVELTGNCATVTDTVVVTFASDPNAYLGPDTTLCAGQAYTLNVTAPGSTITWNDGSQSSSKVITVSGKYSVTISSPCGDFKDTVEVTFVAPPALDLGPDKPLCTGDSIVFDLSALNYDSLKWFDGSTGPQFVVKTPGTYGLTMRKGQCSVSDTVRISTGTAPSIDLGKDTIICVGDRISFKYPEIPGTTVRWQDGSTNREYQVLLPGKYSLEVSNSCGTVSDTVNVEMEDCNCIFYVPNAFTPTKDSTNEVFLPVGCPWTKLYILKIYNRWGEEIFESTDVRKGWDGKFKGEYVEEGVYLYMIWYGKDRQSVKLNKHQSGTLHVLRPRDE